VRVLQAPINNLKAGVVKNNHPVLLYTELLEEEEVDDLEVVGDGEIRPASFEDDLVAPSNNSLSKAITSQSRLAAELTSMFAAPSVLL
jgi:hypothetical protein